MRKISAQEWRELFAWLDTGLELPEDSRAQWLETLSLPASQIDALRDLMARARDGNLPDQMPRFTVNPDDPDHPLALDVAAPGGTVGAYRLLARLGRGGMSSVWIAERVDGLLKRRVAIKLPHLAASMPELAERMARERDILASLEHPGIARLYDAGIAADGRPFLALELVDGVAVDDYCRLHESGAESCVGLVLQTARAVEYAHSRNVLHRDIKPPNILVDSAGRVRLLDFGIGKLIGEGPANTPNDTQFGARAFTPDYSPPEQTQGGIVTAASDIYSLGVVLYQLLCSALPFPAGERRRSPIRAPSSIAPARKIAGDLDTIVLKMLKETAAERYPTMSAVADDIERFLRGEPILAKPDSLGYRARKFAERNRRMVVAVAGTIAVAIIVSLAIVIRQSRQHDVNTARAIAQAADAIAERLIPPTARTRDPIAYREYLHARSLMLRPTEPNLREIVSLAQSATTRDPQFAHAHALLAGANVQFLDNGFSNPDALVKGDTSARRALALHPRLPGAYATLGTIAAHRGDWNGATAQFELAFANNDGTGRIRARYAQTVLLSTGRIREALRLSQEEFRLTPGHARGAMQVATTASLLAGHEAEASRYVVIALSLGWPSDARDVQKVYSILERRAGRGVPTIDSGPGITFETLMSEMQQHTISGELDRAYEASERWLALSRRTGLSGIPDNAGFWLAEMRAFRADARFAALAARMGFPNYWAASQPADSCTLRPVLRCSGE
ncbi:MAG: serine/threonine protein kinase [Steroidobacteraceae bacterium]|nr:serine/threonine protein kinase [Steroidobacteraceae bacterium]